MSGQAAFTDAKMMEMDTQSLAGHATSAMTEDYIINKEFKRIIVIY